MHTHSVNTSHSLLHARQSFSSHFLFFPPLLHLFLLPFGVLSFLFCLLLPFQSSLLSSPLSLSVQCSLLFSLLFSFGDSSTRSSRLSVRLFVHSPRPPARLPASPLCLSAFPPRPSLVRPPPSSSSSESTFAPAEADTAFRQPACYKPTDLPSIRGARTESETDRQAAGDMETRARALAIARFPLASSLRPFVADRHELLKPPARPPLASPTPAVLGPSIQAKANPSVALQPMGNKSCGFVDIIRQYRVCVTACSVNYISVKKPLM